MATHQPPPPPAFAMTPPGSQNGRRISRFTEHPMQEYTPANSVYEEELEYEEDDHGRELSETRTLLRISGSAVHLVLCTLLLAIMSQFVKDYSGNFGRWVIPQAITLLVLASLDILLDILSLVRCRRRWQSWALLLRLVYAIGYLAIFMVYIGLGRAFPPGYSYWGMPSGYSGPVVYLFLWVIGVWNLLHTALRRHHLGNGMRAYISALHSLTHTRQARDRNQRPAAPQTRRSSRSTARIAQSWGRVRRGAAHDPEQGRRASLPSTRSDSISLRERREEEEDKTVSVTSSSSQGKADEAGETPPRALPRARVRP